MNEPVERVGLLILARRRRRGGGRDTKSRVGDALKELLAAACAPQGNSIAALDPRNAIITVTCTSGPTQTPPRPTGERMRGKTRLKCWIRKM